MQQPQLKINKKAPTNAFQALLNYAQIVVDEASVTGKDLHWICGVLRDYQAQYCPSEKCRIDLSTYGPNGGSREIIRLQYGNDGLHHAHITMEEVIEQSMQTVDEMDLMEG